MKTRRFLKKALHVFEQEGILERIDAGRYLARGARRLATVQFMSGRPKRGFTKFIRAFFKQRFGTLGKFLPLLAALLVGPSYYEAQDGYARVDSDEAGAVSYKMENMEVCELTSESFMEFRASDKYLSARDNFIANKMTNMILAIVPELHAEMQREGYSKQDLVRASVSRMFRFRNAKEAWNEIAYALR